MCKKLMIVLHNVSSPQRLIDTARVVYNLISDDLVKCFIITRVTGMAAQTGVPEVSKTAYRLGKSFIVLPTLNDAIEIMKPSKVYLMVKTPTSKPLSETEIVPSSMIVLSGNEDGFSKSELGLGDHIHIKGFSRSVGAPAETAILLYTLLNKSC
jgi:SpoU rRNA methylase family enzyme